MRWFEKIALRKPDFVIGGHDDPYMLRWWIIPRNRFFNIYLHKFLHDGGKPPVSLEQQIIYHCGPVVIKEKGKWVVKAAGPTTSIREEPYQAHLIEKS